MKIKIVALSLFISGAGTKLIQSQIGNSKHSNDFAFISFAVFLFTLGNVD